jgi:four helix bundle protein
MESRVKSYRDLLIWQKGIDLVEYIYVLTKKFPREEIAGLTGQIRRAAISIPSNIAEGQARQHTGEFRQFLHIALGSLAELDTQGIIAHRLKYITGVEVQDLEGKLTELRKMLISIIAKLK